MGLLLLLVGGGEVRKKDFFRLCTNHRNSLPSGFYHISFSIIIAIVK
jgi:hypothetical protein